MLHLPALVTKFHSKKGLIRYEIEGFSFNISLKELDKEFTRGVLESPFYTAVISKKYRFILRQKYGLNEGLDAIMIRQQLPRYNPKSGNNSPPINLGFLAIYPNPKVLQVRLIAENFQFNSNLESRIIQELANYRDNTSQPRLL